MLTPLRSILVCASLLAACASPSEPAPAAPGQPEAQPELAPLDALRAHVGELPSWPEHSAQQIEVQHLLISFDNKVPGASRSRAEAELLSAQLYAQLRGGADFDALVRAHTDDSYPGVYAIHADEAAPSLPGSRPRSGYVPAFGDVGWRLQLDEVGVAGFDAARSPYGWHLVRRTR